MISGFNHQIKGLVVNEFYPKLMHLAPPWHLYQLPNAGTISAETVLACRKIFPRPAHIGSRKHNKNDRSHKNPTAEYFLLVLHGIPD